MRNEAKMRETESKLIDVELTETERNLFFKLKGYTIIDEKREGDSKPSVEAIIMIESSNNVVEHTADVGNGPVNALDNALRKALSRFFPEIQDIKLLDYSVQAIQNGEDKSGTASGVLVNITSTDGVIKWRTTCRAEDVIEASWTALVDSFTYKLIKNRTKKVEFTCCDEIN